MSYYEDPEDADYEAEVMGGSAKDLAEAVVGHKIVSVETNVKTKGLYYNGRGTRLTLDDGTIVDVSDTDDCCAYTQVESLKFLEGVDNAITRVETSENFDKWYVYAESVPVLDIDVAWSPGNPYYYGFGFEIVVTKPGEPDSE